MEQLLFYEEKQSKDKEQEEFLHFYCCWSCHTYISVSASNNKQRRNETKQSDSEFFNPLLARCFKFHPQRETNNIEKELIWRNQFIKTEKQFQIKTNDGWNSATQLGYCEWLVNYDKLPISTHPINDKMV